MSAPTPAPAAKDYGRAGRNLPAAIASSVVILGAVALSLLFYKAAFMVIVALAVAVAVWELHRALRGKNIDLPQEPLVIGGFAMVVIAYEWGADALVSAMAVVGLLTIFWVLRRGVDGFVRNASAAVFTIFYVPFLGSFVALMLAEGGARWKAGGGLDDDGVKGVIAFVLVTIASDIGGYVAGVLFGRHPMAPVISPKKSWEGFAGSAVCTIAVGVLLIVLWFDAAWYIGVALGAIAVIGAVLGDLTESVIKRDLGLKDMSQAIPGHGGVMDRLDSLVATIAPIWLLLHYTVFH